MHSRFNIAAALIAGGIAGTAMTTLLSGRRDAGSSPPTSPSVNVIVGPNAYEARLQALEKQALAPLPPSAPPAAASEVSGSLAAPTTTPGEAWPPPGQTHAKLLASALAEPRDAKWANAMTLSIRKDFEALAPATKSTVESIDCRNVSCVVRLSWKSFEDARLSGGALSQYFPSSRCGIAVSLDPPTDKKFDASYSSAIVMDCEGVKYDN